MIRVVSNEFSFDNGPVFSLVLKRKAESLTLQIYGGFRILRIKEFFLRVNVL